MGASRRERARGLGAHALTVLVCAGLGVLSVVICGYRFGVDDQAQYLVQVIGLWEPGVFGADPYLRVFGSLGSVFWHGVAMVADESNIGVVVLAMTLGIASLNAVLLSGIGRLLVREFGSDRWWVRAGGLMGVVLVVVPKELNWFGVVSLADMELTATLAAVAFVFGSLYCWVRGWRASSLVLSGVCVLVHAQTGGALLAAWWCASAWCAVREGKGWVGVGVVGVLSCAGLVVAAETMGLDAERTAAVGAVGRDLYTELIEPTTVMARSWGAMLGLIWLGVLAAVDLRGRIAGSAVLRGFVVWWAGSMVYPVVALGMDAVGLEHVLLWRLMTGRAFMLGQVGAVVMLGVWCAVQAGAGGRRLFDGALVLVTVAAWPFPLLGDLGGAVGLFGVGATIIGPGSLGIAQYGGTAVRAGAARRAVISMGITIAFLVGLAVVSFTRREHAWTVRTDDAAWLGVQAWARAHSEEDAVFVTPPYLTGWRIGSHRATVGELRDGGLLFYRGDDVVAWRERMNALGIDQHAGFMVDSKQMEGMRSGYHAAIGKGIDEMFGAPYVVRERGLVEGGEVIWVNQGFEVVGVGG